MTFVSWDGRPAVIVGLDAFAKLSPSAPWSKVDEADVFHTGAEMSETAWRDRFARYAPLDFPISPSKPTDHGATV
jgi:hypothetical protein